METTTLYAENGSPLVPVWTRWNRPKRVRAGDRVLTESGNYHTVARVVRVDHNKPKDHKCDARCRNARGESCTCECGGVNHGMGLFLNA